MAPKDDQDSRDLWEAISELRKETSEHKAILMRIDTRQELILERHDKDLEALKCRMTALEHRIWWASGFAAAIGLIVGYVLKALGKG